MSASRSDTSPTWSPDGRRIAFHSCSLDLQRCDLALMRPDGQARRALVRHIDGLPSDPVWSPDGRQLAYTVMFGPVGQTGPRSQGRTVGVYVVRADGSGLRRVAQTRPVGIDVAITSRQPGRRTAAASPTPTSAASWRSSSQAASDAD